MANRILIKKSSVLNKVPVTTDTDAVNGLDYGELAINYNNGKLYYRTSSNTISWFDSTYPSQTANTILAAPSGSAGTPSFRSLVALDIPNLDASKITSGTIDSARLPSYVSDVFEYANLAGFPLTGETNKIYVALDTNKTYRWGGSTYIQITSGAVDSVGGYTGVVTSANLLASMLTVDGTTSGLDADLLDGQHGSYYAAAANYVAKAGDTMTGTLNLPSDGLTVGTSQLVVSSGNVGIGTASTPVYKLEVNGSFAATTKSFVIDHPTKPDMRLRYGSLEGPENGIYIRGKLKGNLIELPDYWVKLVDPDSITVSLTPIGKYQKLYVESIENNVVVVANDSRLNTEIDCHYVVYGERADVEKMTVEIPK